ncbi:zf-HC2 domain-containing protein [Streptomyces sp. YIM S03343]
MRSLERHRDVGAYALGVLNEADAFRFEDHLMECPRCSADVTEFGPTARQLLLYRRATPRFVHPAAQPGPRLLDRLLAEVSRRHRARRRLSLYALAASVVLAMAGPALALWAGPGEQSTRIAATDTKTGVSAQVTTKNADWGSDVLLTIQDVPGSHACRLIAVGSDGAEQTVTTWTSPDRGSGPSKVQGGSTMHSDEIDHYDVRTAEGANLLTLKPR